MDERLINNNSVPHFIESYLKKYGLERWNVEPLQTNKYNNIVVVPAIAEYENLLKLVKSISENGDEYVDETLFFFVINNSESADEKIKSNNEKTIRFFRELKKENTPVTKLKEIISDRKINIGFVDASSPGNELPEKDAGVGLARKIGLDISLKLFDYGNSTKKVLICLDADCLIEKNYLKAIVEEVNKKNIEAGYVQYEHRLPEDEIEKHAIVCYEIFLRYYTLGLVYAGSPFSFAAIGSTMFCDAESYCRIGGMNKRKAAEDFYFLEKLAKITRIHKIDSSRVYPSSRQSWRVPFGTGQRINRFLAKTHEEYMLYDPNVFVVLKKWIEVFYSEKVLSRNEYLKEAEIIDPFLHSFLKMNSFAESWDKIIKNSKTSEQIQKQKTMWMDGFRTLKLVHYLRDVVFPQINMFDALDEIFSMMGVENEIVRKEKIPPLNVQLSYLKKVRDIS
jgi:hypothetical protein